MTGKKFMKGLAMMEKGQIKARVLIADSNSEFRTQCAQNLKRHGIEIVG
jgi:hypothetical protein